VWLAPGPRTGAPSLDGFRLSRKAIANRRDLPRLLVYHLMFEPDADEACPSCTFWIDNVGHLSHLHARNTTFTAISRAPIERLERYKQRMGWTIPRTPP
jgi:predicted dithiol-disulfide oxidoreductase (DUF899 family)